MFKVKLPSGLEVSTNVEDFYIDGVRITTARTRHASGMVRVPVVTSSSLIDDDSTIGSTANSRGATEASPVSRQLLRKLDFTREYVLNQPDSTKRVIGAFTKEAPLRLREMSRITGMSYSKCSGIAQKLTSRGILVRQNRGEYALSGKYVLMFGYGYPTRSGE